jgi:hypothetical protein
MRRRLLLATVLLLAVPAATAEAQLPQASQPGIRVSRSAGGRVAITFLDTAAGRRAYRRYAGRTVTIRCQSIADRVLGAGPTGVATAKVRFRSSLSTLRLRFRGNVNLCTFGSVSVATDATARKFLADLGLAAVLPEVAARAARSGAAPAVRRLGKAGVVIGDLASTPRRGRIGVYARGGVAAAVARSASGRRLFWQMQGQEIRTNVLAPLDQLGPTVTPPGVKLPSGDFPPAGTPLPATTDPEVTARREGSQAVIDFTGGARDALRGRRVTVACTTHDAGGLTSSGVSAREDAPTGGRPLRVRVAATSHVCTVTYGSRLARVALDDAGRTELEEATVSAAMDRVLRTAGAEAAPGYPSAQALSDRLDGAVVPLAAPTDNPPDRRVGAWSDGDRKLTLVAIARTGKRLFLEISGDVVRTNELSLPDLP